MVVMPHAESRQPFSLEEFLALPDGHRFELVRATLIEKAAPTFEHGLAQSGVDRTVGARFARKPGGAGPGGWWFLVELDVLLGGDVLRPDVCGYRRERLAEKPRTRPVTLAPDWVCEVLSPSTASSDRVDKLQAYFRAGVPHYWLLDPVEGTLEVYRRTDLAYALVLTAKRGQRVNPEPFDAESFDVNELLGDS